MTKEIAQEFKNAGNSHFRDGDYESALDAFTSAIENDPNDHVLYSNRSGTYINLGLPDLALEDAKKCVELNPQWAKGYSRLGAAYYKLDEIQEAEEAYSKGLEIDPNNQALNDGLLLCQRPSRPVDPISSMFGDLLNDPEIQGLLQEDPQLLMSVMGKLGALQSNPAEALSMLADPNPKVRNLFQKIIQKMMGPKGAGLSEMFGAQDPATPPTEVPNFSDMPDLKSEPKAKTTAPEPKGTPEVEKIKELSEYERLKAEGNAQYKARNFEKALDLYDQAFEASEKKELIVFSNKAAVYMEMKDYEKAKESVSKALDMRAESKCSYEVAGKLMARMAAIYERERDFAKAVEWYERSLVEDNVRKVRGDLSKAKLSLAQKTKEDYFDDEKAEEARVAGNDFFKTGNFPEALKQYEEGIKRNPNDARIYSNRAACFLKLFDPPNALRSIEKALEIDPKFVRAYARKGEIHMKMKEMHKAMEAYEQGLKIDPTDQGCKDGLQAVVYKIQSTSMSNEVDEKQQQRAMQDPEIQKILNDPQFRLMLGQAQENPDILNEAMKDPNFAKGIEKLIAAGILKVG